MTDIRHIAPQAASDRLFLTAVFEHRVRVWSFADRSLIAELDTVLDFGGQRLALCGQETPIVVAGAWERHGICGYAPDGTRLWQRKDLRQPQYISPTADGALVVAGFDQRPLHVLRAESGETVATVRAVRRFYASPYTDDVASFDADGGSSVSCGDLTGETLWRWTCPPEVNCPALAWDGDASEWVGVLNHVNNERPDTLVRWSADGEVLSERPLALFAEYAFLPGGRHLVTSDGAVRETREGSIVWQL